MGSLKRLMCAIRGHEDYLHFESNRVYLQCVGCGHETPGWIIENRRPVVRFQPRPAKVRSPFLMKKTA